MKVLIIEDEALAAERLERMLSKYDPSIRILAALDTVKEAVPFLANRQDEVELIFLDIQLADGQSFEIFEHVDVHTPIIFVTAYDEFALEAFKVNSVDYLMKPVRYEELSKALDKYKTWVVSDEPAISNEAIKKLLSSHYKSRFLVKSGQKMFFKHVPEISHFFAEDKYCYLIESGTTKKYLMDYNLESLQSLLNPQQFFRINRSVILNIEAIHEIRKDSTQRFQVDVQGAGEPFVVSRAKSTLFRNWLEG